MSISYSDILLSMHLLLLLKTESASVGYKQGSGLKRSTSLAGVLERSILTQLDYSRIWVVFSGGGCTMCSKYALERNYLPTHIPS